MGFFDKMKGTASQAVSPGSQMAERDKIMRELAARHTGYGWERNAGYGTAAHLAAIKRLGITPEHRRSFRPISESLAVTY